MNAIPDSDKVVVIVVGDSGVGKTALVHLIAHGAVCSSTVSTVGANLDVMIHAHKSRPFFVELYDVGGSTRYEKSRRIFYSQGFDGIILVHDLSNKNSFKNLSKWVKEVVGADNVQWRGGDSPFEEEEKPFSSLQFNLGFTTAAATAMPSSTTPNVDDVLELEQPVTGPLPVLLVGNKSDTLTSSRASKMEALTTYSPYGISVSALDAMAFAPGTAAHQKLTAFLDRVVRRRWYGAGGTGGRQQQQQAAYQLPVRGASGVPLPASPLRIDVEDGVPQRRGSIVSQATLAASPLPSGVPSVLRGPTARTGATSPSVTRARIDTSISIDAFLAKESKMQ